jgi:hypothetical protein
MILFDILVTFEDYTTQTLNFTIPDQIQTAQYGNYVTQVLLQIGQTGAAKLENNKVIAFPPHRILKLEADVPTIEIISPGNISSSGPSNIKID